MRPQSLANLQDDINTADDPLTRGLSLRYCTTPCTMRAEHGESRGGQVYRHFLPNRVEISSSEGKRRRGVGGGGGAPSTGRQVGPRPSLGSPGAGLPQIPGVSPRPQHGPGVHIPGRITKPESGRMLGSTPHLDATRPDMTRVWHEADGTKRTQLAILPAIMLSPHRNQISISIKVQRHTARISERTYRKDGKRVG